MPTADTTAITADSTIYTSDHYPQDYIDQRAARATGVVPAKAAKAFCSGWKRTLNPGLSVLADATTHAASFDIADTDTSGLALGDYEYRVEVVDDSSNIVVPIFSDRQRLLRLIDN